MFTFNDYIKIYCGNIAAAFYLFNYNDKTNQGVFYA